jgi:methylmalonyl-CoA mutase cobalamin-binding subunit
MKQIQNFLFEASIVNQVDNIIISGCGSMHNENVINVIKSLKNNFKNANLYVYDGDKDEVIPLKDINDFKANGPHNNNLSGIAKFYKDHLGEITIFIQN